MVSSTTLKNDLYKIRFAIIGLGLVLLCQASLRFSGMTGIYPLEVSLVIRHTITVLAAVVMAAIFTFGKADLSTKTIRVLGLFLSLALSVCFAFSYGLHPGGTTFAFLAEVSKEAIIFLLFILWFRILLPYGISSVLLGLGAADVCQGILQLATCWLQYDAHLAFITLTPLASAAFLLLSTRDTGETSESTSIEYTASKALFPVLLLIIFLLSLAVGQIIYMALSHQQAMSTSVFAEVSMGLGNCFGGIFIILFAQAFPRLSFSTITLFVVVALVAITFYFSNISEGIVAGFFLVISSFAIKANVVYVVLFSYLSAQSTLTWNTNLQRYAIAYGTVFLAQGVSSALMIAYANTMTNSYHIVVGTALVLLLVCSIILLRLVHETENNALQAPVPVLEDPIDSPLRPFHQAIQSLSVQHMLTAQESNVLAQLAQGLNAKSISEAMTLSTNTIRSHMRNVYAKLGVHSQQELINLVNAYVEDIKNNTQ